jgi:hypothetical protein
MSGINVEIDRESTSVTIKLLPENTRSIKLSADQLLRLIEQLKSFTESLLRGDPCAQRSVSASPSPAAQLSAAQSAGRAPGQARGTPRP